MTTLTASIAPRPRRALVVGGLPNFVEATFRRKAEAWGLKIEWHWEMGERRREVKLPAGCEVVIYFSDMVDQPATWGPALKAAAEASGALLIRTVRKAAIWQQDFARAGLREDHNHPMKESPPMPPTSPPPPKIIPPTAPRTYKTIIADMIDLLDELEKLLDRESKNQQSAEELLAKATEAIKRAEAAEAKIKALDVLRDILR